MLSDYHQTYAEKPDEDIAHRASVKDLQLRQALTAIGMPTFTSPMLRVAVLGCAEKRLIEHHRRMFETIFSKPVTMTTLDITVEHLADASGGVIQHDATKPLPLGPYDIVYADILVRFVEPALQCSILKNAYDALAPGGIALVTFAHEDYDPPPGYEPIPGTYRVDMNALQLELVKQHIAFLEIPTTVETIPPGKTQKMKIEDLFFVLRK